MNGLGGLEKIGIALCVVILIAGIAVDVPFLTVFGLVGVACFLGLRGLVGAHRSSEASKPLQERIGTVLKRTQTAYRVQNYQVQFEDNGEIIIVTANDGEGPMHLQPGDYGLLSVRGHTLYAFEPKNSDVSDEAVAVNGNFLFADQLTDWIDVDGGND